MSEQKKGILLDSGTNELEIVTYTIGRNLFSINVMKVREIIHPTEVTAIPESHPAIEGVLQVRGEIIPVINLAKALHINSNVPLEKTKFIIAELNQMKVVFRVDEVHRIQRISWQQIEEPASLSMGLEETTSGIVKLDDKIILMLDYEKLVYDISPSSVAMVEEEAHRVDKKERTNKRLYIAEDSGMLRQMLEKTLSDAGYANLTFFKNGEEALNHIEKITIEQEKHITDVVDLLITDIEMPKVDGHHLTKRVRENSFSKDLPVVIFSSLISDELRHKGEAVGATAQISKPEIANLISVIDSIIL